MAISKEVFIASQSDLEYLTAVKSALESINIFDSVDYLPGSTPSINATKDSHLLITITRSNVKVYNNSGTLLNTYSITTYVGIGPMSVCVCGNSVLLIAIGSGNPPENFSVCINETIDGYVCVCGMAFNTSATRTCTTSCEQSAAINTGYGLSAPLSTSYANVSLYKVTTPLTNGTLRIFSNVYGIRFSPNLFTVTGSTDGVVPPTIIINGTTYLTDGYICIADA